MLPGFLYTMGSGWDWGPSGTPSSRWTSYRRRKRRAGIKPVKPTISKIQERTTPDTFKSGMECLGRNGVIYVETDRGVALAQVVDGETYDVAASLGYGSGSSYCTCPHDAEGECKHVVAVLLYVSGNFKQIILSEKNKEKRKALQINDILQRLSADQLREFLGNALERDSDLREQFLKRFSRAKIWHNIRADLDAVYDDMGDAGLDGAEVNFDPYLKLAKSNAEKNDYDEAIRIYREIVDVIDANMENVDDSYAHYNTIVYMALERMAKYIILQELNHEQKRKHIAYLHHQFITDNYGCDTMYQDTLKTICTTKEDHAYLQELNS